MATYPSPTLQNLTVNGTATLTDVSSAAATITGGTIDGTPIGATTPAAVHATTINSTGAATLASVSTASATLTGGTVDGVTIGGTTPEAIHATTLSASGTVSGTGFTNLLSPYPTSATLAASGGSALLGFLQAGTGAVARTVQDKQRDIVSVKDFGATGNGSTDDYAAFAQHLADYPNGQMYLPMGTYVIGTNITLTQGMQFAPGAILAPKTGVTITLNGPIDALDYQIFSNAQGGSFAFTGLARSVRATWFGLMSTASSTANPTQASANVTAMSFLLSALDTNGYRVILPAGYIHTNGFVINTNSITFEGSYGGTMIINNSTNQAAFATNSGSVFSVNYVDMKFGQASGVTAISGNCAIYSQAIQWYVREVSISNFPSAPYNGLILNGCSGVWLNTLNISGMLNDGVVMSGNTSDVFINGAYSNSNGACGFHFEGASGVYGTNVNGYNNGLHAFFFDNIGSINQFIFGQAWIGDTSGDHNWNCLNLSDSSFSDSWGSTQKSISVNTTASGLNITSANCFNLNFTGFNAITNNGNGIVVDNGALSVKITSSNVRNNGKGGVGNNQNGIVLGFSAAVNNCMIIGARCVSNPAYGIWCPAFASDYNIISSCNTQGNTGGGLVNSMTGTHNQIGTGANV